MWNSMVVFTLSVFDRKYPFWANLVQNSNGDSVFSNMQNSVAVFTFFCFRAAIPFFGKCGPKNWNCQCKPKFDTETNSYMYNSMVVFTFFIFDGKYPSRANLVQKFSIVSLRWNLILRLIRICIIQWWCSFFLVLTENALFGQIWSENHSC